MNTSALRIAVCGGTTRNAIGERLEGESQHLGRLLAQANLHVVCSGNRSGVIGQLIDGVASAGGSVSALVLLDSDEVESTHDKISDTRLISSVAERKKELVSQARIIIGLPGGLGTHDELISILVDAKAGRPCKLVLVNVDDFFLPFIQLLDHLVKSGFLSERHVTKSLHIAISAELAMEEVRRLIGMEPPH